MNIFKTIILLLFISGFYNANAQFYFKERDSIPVFQSNQLTNAWSGGINSAQFSTIDVNMDGTDELFVFDRSGNLFEIYEWEPSSNVWIRNIELKEGWPDLRFWAILRDYNCDGKKDIFSYVSGGIGIWRNESTANVTQFVKVTDPYLFSYYFNPNPSNLYVSKVDIPDINDIDGDGDLDVLTFGVLGNRLEYHMNMSVENGYDCDSLQYEIANECWGHFLETGFATNTTILKDTCSANLADPKNARHAGSTVLSLNLNNDTVKDVILGDVSFDNVVALYNDPKGVNMNTSFISQDTIFPSGTTPVDLHIFPGSFYEDLDQDGVRDLVFSPNIDTESENEESVWFYKNFSNESSPIFGHIENDFLQKTMFDLGKDAYPVLFDYNNDGLVDLFVSSFGSYDQNLTNNYLSTIRLYENTGLLNSPEYSLITDDFANISSQALDLGVYPTFGDIDGDGDVDMLVGDYSGNVRHFDNTSSSMSIMNLTLVAPTLKDDDGNNVDVGKASKPQLFDIDNDGDLDLIIGEENGNLNYYDNIGSATNFSLRLVTETLGNVQVNEVWTTIGNSVPHFFRNNQNEIEMLCGTARGHLFHYTDIVNNLTGSFTLLDSTVSNIYNGANSCPTSVFFNSDTLRDVIIGNERGGLNLYYGTTDVSVSVSENDNMIQKVNLFPNPSSGIVNVITNHTFETVTIFDQSGRIIKNLIFSNYLDLSDLSKGLYLIKFDSSELSVVKRVIINE